MVKLNNCNNLTGCTEVTVKGQESENNFLKILGIVMVVFVVGVTACYFMLTKANDKNLTENQKSEKIQL